MSDNGKILVTGASGFIGARIVEVLYLKGQKNVRAGIWRWSSAARIGRFPLDIVKVDLMDKDEIEKAMDGVTAVIHCAKGPAGVTVEGTKNLLDAALRHKVKRFVHLSTAEIYGDAEGEISEEFPYKYTGNEYNQTKIDAEKVCWEYSKKGLPLTVIRPSIVYGPFSKNWTTNFARMLVAGQWGAFEKYGNGRCNLIYVDDLIRAIFLSLKDEKAVGQAFNVNGTDEVTWNDYFKKFNDSLGLPPLKEIKTTTTYLRTAMIEPVRFVGKFARDHFMGVVKAVAEHSSLAKNLMKKTEMAIKTTPAPVELRLFNRNSSYPAGKIQQQLGYKPAFSLDDGLKISSEWVKHQGFLLKFTL